MIPLQVECAGAAGAVACKVEAPARAADAFGEVVERAGGARRDAPAGLGGTGLGRRGLAEQEAGYPALPGAEGETPAGGEVEHLRVAAQLAEHGGEPGTAESFLEHPQRLLRAPGLDHQEPWRSEAELAEAGAMGIAAFAERRLLGDEEDRAVIPAGESGEQGRGEAEGGGGLAGGSRPDLVQGIPAEPAAEHPVGCRHPEGQHRLAPLRQEAGAGRGGVRRRPAREDRLGAVGERWKARSTLDLGDTAGQPDNSFPRHESASAHGFETHSKEFVPDLFYRFRRRRRESSLLGQCDCRTPRASHGHVAGKGHFWLRERHPNARGEARLAENHTSALAMPASLDDRRVMKVLGWATASHLRACAILVVVALACFLPGLAGIAPVDRDEARFVQATRQMLETGDFVDIRLQDEPRYKKPAGIYWLQAAMVTLTGHGANAPIWAYRLASVLGGLAAVLLTYWAAMPLFGRRAGLVAGMLMATTLLLAVEAHLAKTDATLLATVVLAQGVLARAYAGDRDRSLPLGTALLFWVGLGLGILVKGPIVVMVAGLTALALLAVDRKAGWLLRLRPLVGVPLTLLIVLPWFVAILSVAGMDFFGASVGNDLLGKVASGQESHWGPPGYHLVLFFVLFLPAVMLLPSAIGPLWTGRRQAAVKFCLAWLLPSWLVFELVATKLPHPPPRVRGGALWRRAPPPPKAGWSPGGGGPGALASCRPSSLPAYRSAASCSSPVSRASSAGRELSSRSAPSPSRSPRPARPGATSRSPGRC